ncbi:hypothetical protein SASPL_153442 [Salvia splendens]|uniref:Uncharacterized protein n=1 Tax=Salvia splendens TaxID=180675 RepID=A0A8X8Z1B2_SALSN|nr:hypothetical protein SASPL_153442 [Salvia splendens]
MKRSVSGVQSKLLQLGEAGEGLHADVIIIEDQRGGDKRFRKPECEFGGGVEAEGLNAVIDGVEHAFLHECPVNLVRYIPLWWNERWKSWMVAVASRRSPRNGGGAREAQDRKGAEANMKSKEEELDRLYNKIKDESNAKVEEAKSKAMEAKSNAKVEEVKSNAKVKEVKKTDGDSKDVIVMEKPVASPPQPPLPLHYVFEFKDLIIRFFNMLSRCLSHRDSAAAVHDFHLSFDVPRLRGGMRALRHQSRLRLHAKRTLKRFSPLYLSFSISLLRMVRTISLSSFGFAERLRSKSLKSRSSMDLEGAHDRVWGSGVGILFFTNSFITVSSMATTEENPNISELAAAPTKKGRSKKASNPTTTAAMASPTREEIANYDLEKQVQEMQEELEKLKIVKEEAEANMKSKEEELDRLYNKIKDESNAKVC